MTIERYNITLDSEIVNKVREELEKYGGKISGLINDLLKRWLDVEKKKKGGKKIL